MVFAEGMLCHCDMFVSLGALKKNKIRILPNVFFILHDMIVQEDLSVKKI